MEGKEGFIEYLYALFMQLPIVIRWMLLIITVVGFIYKIWPSLVNYVRRPKLHIEFKNGNHLTFTKAGEKDKYIDIPCLSIRNDKTKTLKIISSPVMLGNNKIPTGSGEIIRKLYENGYAVKKIKTISLCTSIIILKMNIQILLQVEHSFLLNLAIRRCFH